MYKRAVALLACVAVLLAMGGVPARADITEDIAAKQRQIAELQRQIDEYQQQIDTNRSKANTLQNEIAKLNAQISQVQLEIRSLEASIDQTGLEIQDTQSKIADTQSKIAAHRDAMVKYLRLMNETDQATLTNVLLNNATISEFFDDVNRVQMTQDKLRVTVQEMRSLQEQLENRQLDLEGRQSDLEKLKTFQEIARQTLSSNKATKNQVLRATQGEEAKYQELVKKSQLDIARLRDQINYLVQSGISVEDAVTYAKLAAIGAGIRPAFLLALLEVESRLGQNVGSGNWRDDMYLCYQRLAAYYPAKKSYYLKRAEDEKAAFMTIVGKLGLDPDSVKVSKEPNYGCGGAMGPAQFIPTTWLAYEADVVRLTGHDPVNPWNFQDAFTASAIKLARGGATSQTRAGEDAAARAYIGGSTKCSSSACNYYANLVLQKAAEIAQSL